MAAGITYGMSFGPITIYFGTAPPSEVGDGTHYQRGDLIVNMAGAIGSYPAWQCVYAAVPGSTYGSWQHFAALA